MMCCPILINSPGLPLIGFTVCMILTSWNTTIGTIFTLDALIDLISSNTNRNASPGYQSFRNNICGYYDSGYCNRDKASLDFSFLNRSKFDAFDSGKGVGRGGNSGGDFGDQDRGTETGEHNACNNLFHNFSPR